MRSAVRLSRFQHWSGEAAFFGCVKVECIGFDDDLGLGDKCVRQLFEEGIFGVCRQCSQIERSGTSTLGDVFDEYGDLISVHVENQDVGLPKEAEELGLNRANDVVPNVLRQCAALFLDDCRTENRTYFCGLSEAELV